MLALVVVFAAGGAVACSVPVFRYALERWPADRFEVTLVQRGALASNEQAVADALRTAADVAANYVLNVVDVAEPTNRPLPWLDVRYPLSSGLDAPAWEGPLTADAARALLDSPVRRELVRRLAAGQAVVWLLLDTEPVEAARIERELRTLEKVVPVPEVDPDDPRTKGNAGLTLRFSVLPLSRTDAAETQLVSMLVNLVPKDVDRTGPLAFPVFGRGRVLDALDVRTLDAPLIRQATEYLCGDCSCEIKDQNPGTDLLIVADWDALIDNPLAKGPYLPPLVSLATVAAAAAPPAPLPDAGGTVRRNMLWAAGGLAGVVALATLLVGRGRRS